MSRRSRSSEPHVEVSEDALRELQRRARPLRKDADLDPLLEQIGDDRYVLLGEASHGTHEFYAWRDRLSRRLIREKGFSFIAVEGDWPDCERIHGYVQGRSTAENARAVLSGLRRWPTWMWANQELVEFAEWLRAHNVERPRAAPVGFYGLDVYSLWDSMNAVIRYLERVDPQAARNARRAYECFAPYAGKLEQYAYHTALAPRTCEDAVVRALTELRQRAPRASTREEFFFAEQNAIVAQNAERYYRAMIAGGPSSWNVRDEHMTGTLERLMAFHGPQAKAIVWAHNTHVGDARYTDMAETGEVNIGQLVRERCDADGVTLVGFSTHRGSVIPAEEWGAPAQTMQVPPARVHSIDDLCQRVGRGNALFCFGDSAGSEPLLKPRTQRAIGVVYHPGFEHYGNYVPSVLPRRYDALIFVEETHALKPLPVRDADDKDEMETFPSGV